MPPEKVRFEITGEIGSFTLSDNSKIEVYSRIEATIMIGVLWRDGLITRDDQSSLVKMVFQSALPLRCLSREFLRSFPSPVLEKVMKIFEEAFKEILESDDEEEGIPGE